MQLQQWDFKKYWKTNGLWLPHDKDMIVMYHKFGYELDGKQYQIDSQMH